jgi:hypothetical protein
VVPQPQGALPVSGMPWGSDICPSYHQPPADVLGPVAPGVGVMAKGPQGSVKCEDRLPYYKDNFCSCSLPRLHGHDSATREDLGGGVRGPGPARVGLLGLQCSARALFRAASFKIK